MFWLEEFPSLKHSKVQSMKVLLGKSNNLQCRTIMLVVQKLSLVKSLGVSKQCVPWRTFCLRPEKSPRDQSSTTCKVQKARNVQSCSWRVNVLQSLASTCPKHTYLFLVIMKTMICWLCLIRIETKLCRILALQELDLGQPCPVPVSAKPFVCPIMPWEDCISWQLHRWPVLLHLSKHVLTVFVRVERPSFPKAPWLARLMEVSLGICFDLKWSSVSTRHPIFCKIAAF